MPNAPARAMSDLSFDSASVFSRPSVVIRRGLDALGQTRTPSIPWDLSHSRSLDSTDEGRLEPSKYETKTRNRLTPSIVKESSRTDRLWPRAALESISNALAPTMAEKRAVRLVDEIIRVLSVLKAMTRPAQPCDHVLPRS